MLDRVIAWAVEVVRICVLGWYLDKKLLMVNVLYSVKDYDRESSKFVIYFIVFLLFKIKVIISNRCIFFQNTYLPLICRRFNN